MNVFLYKQWSIIVFTTIEILTKMEAGTKDWGIAVIDLIILLFERIQTLRLWNREAVECFKCYLMGYTSRCMEDSGAECDLSCGGWEGWLKRLQRRSALVCDLEIVLVIFW